MARWSDCSNGWGRTKDPTQPNNTNKIFLLEKDYPQRIPGKLEGWDGRCFWSSNYKVYRKKRERCAKEVKSGPCLGILKPGESDGQKIATKRGSRETEVIFGIGGCRSNTKTWKWYDLHI